VKETNETHVHGTLVHVWNSAMPGLCTKLLNPINIIIIVLYSIITHLKNNFHYMWLMEVFVNIVYCLGGVIRAGFGVNVLQYDGVLVV